MFFSVTTTELLEEGLAVELFDADDAEDQSVTSCSFVIFEEDFDAMSVGSCGIFGDAEVLFQLLPSQ